MERKLAKRKMLRRKYKHYAAAVASAAILAGVALPGIPVARALAAEGITTSPPISSEQTTMVNKDNQKSGKQAWYRYAHRNNDDRHTYKGDGVTVRYRDRYDSNNYAYKGDGVTVRYLNSPVDVIKDYASIYGFDPERDTFKFLSLSSKEASVEVTKHDTGQRFRVDLENTTTAIGKLLRYAISATKLSTNYSSVPKNILEDCLKKENLGILLPEEVIL